jgi:ATP-dependent helicase HrpA
MLTRDELMRHEAAGITEPRSRSDPAGRHRLRGAYLHEPGDPKDGVTVTVPIYALNQASEERCEWLVPGMLKEKVVGLLKTLHQRPRSRLLPLPEFADAFISATPFAHGSLVDALLGAVRERTGLDVRRADFKQEQLPAHLLMNIRVIDENGRQLGIGRNLAALKAELGGLARSAFQSLAALKLEGRRGHRLASGGWRTRPSARPNGQPKSTVGKRAASAPADAGSTEPQRYVAWTFGELPELMEVRKAGQTLVGFPALIDRTTHVEVEVFDEPAVAATKHRAGLRRLFALQVRDALKYLEKNLPDARQLEIAYMPLGTPDDLREQIVDVALDRAFLMEPLPHDAASFGKRLDEGRGRLSLIANEIARSVAAVLSEYTAALRKLKDSRPPKDVAEDIGAQLARLVSKRSSPKRRGRSWRTCRVI